MENLGSDLEFSIEDVAEITAIPARQLRVWCDDETLPFWPEAEPFNLTRIFDAIAITSLVHACQDIGWASRVLLPGMKAISELWAKHNIGHDSGTYCALIGERTFSMLGTKEAPKDKDVVGESGRLVDLERALECSRAAKDRLHAMMKGRSLEFNIGA